MREIPEHLDDIPRVGRFLNRPIGTAEIDRGGRRFRLAPIEACLKQLRWAEDVAVFWQPATKRLCCYVVVSSEEDARPLNSRQPRKAVSNDLGKLCRRHLKKHGFGQHAWPDVYRRVSRLPKGADGRVQRGQLVRTGIAFFAGLGVWASPANYVQFEGLLLDQESIQPRDRIWLLTVGHRTGERRQPVVIKVRAGARLVKGLKLGDAVMVIGAFGRDGLQADSISRAQMKRRLDLTDINVLLKAVS